MRTHLFLLLLLVMSCAGYFAVKDGHLHPFLSFLSLYCLQFLLFGWIIWRALKGHPTSWMAIWGAAVGCRLILWFTDPVLENDYWRYLWDGKMVAHGINPYLYAPSDPVLDSYETDYRGLIGWNQYKTIYPPFSQYVFGLIQLIAADSVIALKIALTLFDLATGGVLMLWLSRNGRDPKWAILYLLNPLVLKEIANSSHLDSLPVFLSMLALYWMSSPKPAPPADLRAWSALALATASKLYPLILVPLFMRLDPRWRRGLLLYIAILVGLYLPFLEAGSSLLSGTRTYATYWIFNAGLFQLTAAAFRWIASYIPRNDQLLWLQPMIANDVPAKVALGSFYLVFLAFITRRLRSRPDLARTAMYAIGALLVISPVVDAWYVLWILPLACLNRSIPWLAFSFLVVASYSWFYSKIAAPYFRFVEYFVFFGLLLVYELRPRFVTVLLSRLRPHQV